MVGLAAESSLGTSEIPSVFGGMFGAFGVACLLTREPIVFGVAGAALLSGHWLA